MAEKEQELRIVVPAILGFPYIFTPQKPQENQQNRKAMYSAALIFTQKPVVAKVRDVLMKAALKKLAGQTQQDIIDLIAADELKFALVENKLKLAKKRYDKVGGIAYANARSQYQPGVVDFKKEQVIDPAEVYAGRPANVSVTAFYYNRDGAQGVSLGLNNIQILGHGTRLDNRIAAEDEFAVDESVDLSLDS